MPPDTADDLQTLSLIQRALASRGIDLDADRSSVALEIDGHRITRPARWLRDVGLSGRARGGPAEVDGVMILGPRIGATTARRIQEAGGWYADAVGNVFVRAEGVLIDVAGRSPKIVGAASRRPGSRNLMSAGRAQVVFCLLTWPALVAAPVRSVAAIAGVSSGLVQTVMRLLEDEGYVSPTSRQLERRGDLVDAWAAAFPLGLARSLELGRFVGEPSPDAWVASGYRVFVSGEFAAPQLEGPDLVLYVPDRDAHAIAASRWRRPEPGERANIIVRRAFWEPPGPGGPGADRVPDLLLYGDLLASNDSRQREIASKLRAAL